MPKISFFSPWSHDILFLLWWKDNSIIILIHKFLICLAITTTIAWLLVVTWFLHDGDDDYYSFHFQMNEYPKFKSLNFKFISFAPASWLAWLKVKKKWLLLTLQCYYLQLYCVYITCTLNLVLKKSIVLPWYHCIVNSNHLYFY